MLPKALNFVVIFKIDCVRLNDINKYNIIH